MVVAGFLMVGFAIALGQMYYVRAKLPEIAAESAAASAEVAHVFEQLIPPADAEPDGPLEKRTLTGGNRSKWKGVETGIEWQRAYMVPGDFGPIAEAYRKRLQGLGWKSFDTTPPSEIQRVFKRGKWIATISSGEWWDYPRRSRVRVRLEWDWRHRTDI
jgi:hypothetical protein